MDFWRGFNKPTRTFKLSKSNWEVISKRKGKGSLGSTSSRTLIYFKFSLRQSSPRQSSLIWRKSSRTSTKSPSTKTSEYYQCSVPRSSRCSLLSMLTPTKRTYKTGWDNCRIWWGSRSDRQCWTRLRITPRRRDRNGLSPTLDRWSWTVPK